METNYKKLTNDQLQVVLTGTFGDGCIKTTKHSGNYHTNCKMKDYLELKCRLLGDLAGTIQHVEKNGYSQTFIWRFSGLSNHNIKEVHAKPLLDKLNLLDDLGIALWMYDDGSIHKKSKFYNLNTHAFNKEDNQIISNFLNDKLGIYSRVMIERKKDGRIFYYLYIPKCAGAYKLSEIMSRYKVDSYSYKLYSNNEVKEYKLLHEYADKVFSPNTVEHFELTKQLNKRFRTRQRKNPDLTIEEFLSILLNKN